MTAKTRTPEQAKAWLKMMGVRQIDLADELKVPRTVIVDLLRGKIKGDRGAAHKAAVALGLKPEPNPAEKAALERRVRRLQRAR
jgi:gp16 family phage-associated protein